MWEMEIVEMVITKWNAKSQKQRNYREEKREEKKINCKLVEPTWQAKTHSKFIWLQ